MLINPDTACPVIPHEINQFLKVSLPVIDCKEAECIISACNIPVELVDSLKQTRVEVILMYWNTVTWLDHYMAVNFCEEKKDFTLEVTEEDLGKLLEDADRVIRNPGILDKVFPIPSWGPIYGQGPNRSVEDDIKILEDLQGRLSKLVGKIGDETSCTSYSYEADHGLGYFEC